MCQQYIYTTSKFKIQYHLQLLKTLMLHCAQSCPILCDLMDYSPPDFSVHGDSPGKNIGVNCHALLQGIFSTQGSNPGLPHYRQILYQLSHQGSPRTLEWVAYPFSWGIFLTQESNQGLLHYMDSLPAELPGKPQLFICTKIFYSHNLGSFCLLFLQICFLLQFICPLFLEFKLHIYQYLW